MRSFFTFLIVNLLAIGLFSGPGWTQDSGFAGLGGAARGAGDALMQWSRQAQQQELFEQRNQFQLELERMRQEFLLERQRAQQQFARELQQERLKTREQQEIQADDVFMAYKACRDELENPDLCWDFARANKAWSGCDNPYCFEYMLRIWADGRE
ncbi:MAG: hypothetical protein OXF39_06135 [Nitrospira sp.]|nr:hypothetical protein [Nitrospira sp.]